MFTFIPKPATGPADNEIWYTTVDGSIINPNTTVPGGGPSSTIYELFGSNIVSNTYGNNKGVIVFDNSISKIGTAAFMNFGKLTSIYIPQTVMSFGSAAFGDCTSLNSIRFTGTKDQWNQIEKGYNWNGKVAYGIVPATSINCIDGDVPNPTPDYV